LDAYGCLSAYLIKPIISLVESTIDVESTLSYRLKEQQKDTVMRAKEFELAIREMTESVEAGASSLTNSKPSDLDIRMRELRKVRMLPTGGRGPHAPSITSEHAAIILIAIKGCAKPVDAALAVFSFVPLVDGDKSFSEALTELLEDQEAAATVDRVELNRTAIAAAIVFKDGKVRRFFRPDRAVDNPEMYGRGRMYDLGVIGAGALTYAAILLQEPDDSTGELVADV
jgi:hypothetical protein